MTTAYPLAWPAGWPRTPWQDRLDAKFRSRRESFGGESSKPVSINVARGRLATELDLLGARLPVLSSNLELRVDGHPRQNQHEPEDHGAACYFQFEGKPTVLACDRWNTVAGNIAAIAAHIGAMRGMARWGVGTTGQMFRGFQALPPATVGQRHWTAVLGLARDVNRDDIEGRRRGLARIHHPDRGGDVTRMAEINAAADQALRDVGAI